MSENSCPLCGQAFAEDLPRHLRKDCPRAGSSSESVDLLAKKATADALETDIKTAVEVERRVDEIEKEVHGTDR